jgi:zinc protease
VNTQYAIRNTHRLAAFLTALISVVLAHAALGQATDWQKIQPGPLPEFHPQVPKRIELPNGLVILLQEDHELPLIRGTAMIRGGSRDEAAEKLGLVQMFGEVWRTGGTKTKTGDELDDYLEARAAKVETSGGVAATHVSWDCLKDNFDDVLKLFIELLREPAFREDKLPLAKDQLDTAISRRNDEPFGIAAREAAKLVYGKDSPYARVPEYQTVAAVTRQDLLDWHQHYVHPNNIILGIVGDFDAPKLESRLRGVFESWAKGPPAPKPQATFAGPKPGLYFVAKDDVTSSTVQMVELGTTRDNPDYYAIEVFNQFFGGSFASRLFSNIRSKKGLAYSVGGGISTDYDHPGMLRLFLGTKSATTAAAIDAFDEELDALKTKPATSEELTKAKEAILNSFIFRFDSKEKVLQERMAYEFYGYPADFLERYRTGIEQVSPADIARVAQKYVHKERMARLVVGKAADFDRPLSSFGQVTTLDISIPEPAKPPAAAASNSEGKALLDKVIAGLGDASKVRAVRSLRRVGTLLTKTPQGNMSMDVEEVAVFPEQVSQKMRTPMGELKLTITPSLAFVNTPMGVQDLPGSQKEEQLKELKREPFYVAQHALDPKFIFAAAGTERLGSIEAKILEVNADGSIARWFIDPETGHILRTSARSTGIGGPPADKVVDYSDWKMVEGLSIPFKETITQGTQTASAELKEVQINPPIDPKLFEKPAAPAK